MKNLASPWLRLLAGLIDFQLGVVVFLLFLLRVAVGKTAAEFLSGILDLIVWSGLWLPFLFIFVNCFLVSSLGGTIGKLLTGVEIVEASGGRVSFWRAFLRNNIGYMVSGLIFYAGFFWMFKDSQKRGWHDMIADTFVVVKNQEGIWIGLLCLVLLTLSNVFLVQGIAANWQKNRDSGVYAPFGQMMGTR